MLYINKITNDPQQLITLTGIKGVTIQVALRFMPRIQRWMMDIDTSDFSLKGLAITTSPNILRQYRNQITFGIACVADSGIDPFTIEDFASQTANLYLLNADDVAAVEAGYYT